MEDKKRGTNENSKLKKRPEISGRFSQLNQTKTKHYSINF